MGTHHARLLATAVAGRGGRRRSPTRTCAAAERLAEEPASHVHADGLELIAADDVDAVVVASPVVHPRAVRARLHRRPASRCCARSRSPPPPEAALADRRGRARRRPPPGHASASCAASTPATST